MIEGSEKITELSDYHRDCPVDDFDIDSFGYKKVAKEVATAIYQLRSNSGYVIAINGKWGSGKSSFLFYTEKYLTDKCNELDIPESDKRPVVFHFDPWLFSGHQDIVSQFFTQLKAQCEINQEKISGQALEILNKIFTYGSYLRTVPTIEGQIAGWGFTGISTFIESKIQKSVKSIFQLKDEIKKGLEGLDEKIVIIIDDIDRLTSEEIRELFRAIKAVADFPNIVYLLAYDEEIVIDALDDEFHRPVHGGPENKTRSGIKYLEKIVQFTVPVPVIGDNQLQSYTQDIVFTDVLNGTNPDLFDQTRWVETYYKGLRHFLSTPRSVIRLHNALELFYPSIKNEVNVVDFICLEIIRQNYPELYNLIKNNHHYFIKDNSVMGLFISTSQDKGAREQFHQDWLKTIKENDREAVKYIIKDLFPDYNEESAFRSRPSGRLDIHVNYDAFLKYFRFQIEPDQISNVELSNFLNTLKDPDVFSEHVLGLKKIPGREGSKALTLFEGLLPIIDENTPKKSLETIVKGCLRIKKEVLTNVAGSSQDLFYRRNALSEFITAVFCKALDFYPMEKRPQLLKEAFSAGTNTLLMTKTIDRIRKQNEDKNGGGESISPDATLSLGELAEIKEICLKRLRNIFLGEPMSFASSDIGTVVRVWNILCSEDPALKSIIDDIWKNERLIIEIIHSSRSNGYIDPIVPYSLEPFKTESEFRGWVNKILEKPEQELTDEEITALKNFLSTPPKPNHVMG